MGLERRGSYSRSGRLAEALSIMTDSMYQSNTKPGP